MAYKSTRRPGPPARADAGPARVVRSVQGMRVRFTNHRAYTDKTCMRGRSYVNRGLPLAADAGPRRALLVYVTTAAVVVAWVVYLLYVTTGPWGIGSEVLFRTWLFSGVLVAASAVCIARALLVRSDRVIWAVLGSGMLSWALGSIYWSAFLKTLDAPPYPSWADALYLSFYPAAYVALMRLVRPRLRAVGPSAWLDGVIGVLAVGAVETAVLIPSMVADTGGSTAVVATNLAYPLCDLLLIALVVGAFALSSWRPGRAWTLIGGGLILFAIADSLYLYRVANETFVEGTWLDAIWVAGMVLLAIAAWQRPPRCSKLGG